MLHLYNHPHLRNGQTQEYPPARTMVLHLENQKFHRRTNGCADHGPVSYTHLDKDDETEMVIRILSFGPMIKVTAPQHFVELIKQRLIRQKSCGL